MHFHFVLLSALAAVANALPRPQGVTADITPTIAIPSGCTVSYSGSFGIAVMHIESTSTGAVTQISDGQPQAVTSVPAVTQISDGQIQATTKVVSVVPVTQISDGQVQATTAPKMMTMAVISMINDGQIQAPTTMKVMAITQISDGQIQAPTATYTTVVAVSQITDGQIQAATATYTTVVAVSQITDGQVQAATATTSATTFVTVVAVSQITDGQPQAVTSATSTVAGVTQIGDGQAQATSTTGVYSPSQVVACASNDTLSLTLSGGVLKDAKGRTGYIASNYQFQFDDPPQAGAIYTGGFSVCSNGTLALGGSAVWYQCLSGDFYNLYNENWAAQCEPVLIDTLKLITCSS